MLARRNFLGSLLAAPAIIRTPGLLMPIKRLSPIVVSNIREVRITELDVVAIMQKYREAYPAIVQAYMTVYKENLARLAAPR